MIRDSIKKDELDNYLNLLPEIAKLLNMSVSAVEHYPTDIQRLLCDVYTNNYKADEITLKQALGQIVQLNTITEQEIKIALSASEKNTPNNHNESHQTKPEYPEQKKQAILTREQIIRNAKIIRDNYYRNQQQLQLAEQEEQIQRKKQ